MRERMVGARMPGRRRTAALMPSEPMNRTCLHGVSAREAKERETARATRGSRFIGGNVQGREVGYGTPASRDEKHLLQTSIATKTEPDVFAGPRSRIVAANCRPTVVCRAKPASSPERALLSRLAVRGVHGTVGDGVHGPAVCRDVGGEAVKAPLPHIAKRVVKPPGVRRIGPDNGCAVVGIAGLCRFRRSAHIAAVRLVAPETVEVRVLIRVQDARTVAPPCISVSRACRELPLCLGGEVKVEARPRPQFSKVGVRVGIGGVFVVLATMVLEFRISL